MRTTPTLSPRRFVWLCLLVLLLPAIAVANVRNWTSQDGREVEAEYIKHNQQEVTMRRSADGMVFRLPINRLSKADQDWLESLRAGGDSSGGSDAVGAGIYIAVGNGAHRMSSQDGITWTNHVFIGKPAHDQNDLKDIAVGNGVCIAIGGFSKSNIFVTRDGVEWEQNPFNIGVLSGVIFHKGKFHVFGEGARVAASKDGQQWEKIGDTDLREHLQQEAKELGLPESLKSNIRAWAEVDGTFVGSGDNGFLLSTRDFKKWNYPPRIDPRSRLYIAADANGFVVEGDQTLHHSPDGQTWTDVSPKIDDGKRFVSIQHDGERFVANTNDGKGWESADGRDWKLIRGATFPGYIATLRPDLYYSFETYWKYTDELLRSTDGGKTWKPCKIPAPTGVTNMIFAEGFPPLPTTAK